LLYESGELEQRLIRAADLLSSCTLCPRRCAVNRHNGETGVCGTADQAVVASYNPHFGEEAPLVGNTGSGTIFFAGCSLKCCFCQNYDISHHASDGVAVDPVRLAAIMLDLQQRGCCNINFVTPTHVVPQIIAALPLAYENGLKLPLVYNSSGYETIETLGLLDGIIDIYMPDIKFWANTSAQTYADAADYPGIVRQAVKEMHGQVGDLETDTGGIATRGLLVRHLLMPGGIDETEQILGFIAAEISKSTYVNIMDQYRPCGNALQHEELRQTIEPGHNERAIALAKQAGLTRLDDRDIRSLLKRLGFSL